VDNHSLALAVRRARGREAYSRHTESPERRAAYWRHEGILAFDYRAQTVHFGTWLDEPEASQIIDELRAFLELSAA
jgi:hypothetical protein